MQMFLEAIRGLKTFDPDGGVSLEDLELTAAFGQALLDGFTRTGGVVPKWLTEKNEQVSQTLLVLRRADKIRQLREWEARADHMKPVDVRRAEAAETIARLKAELGIPDAPAAKA